MNNKSPSYRPVSLVCARPASTVHKLRSSYSWKKFLTESTAKQSNDVNGGIDRCSEIAVPVECFRYIPFKNHMKYYTSKNLMVEAFVPKEYVSESPETWEESYWFAKVLKIAGYRVLLRYVGIDEEEGKVYDFWMNIGSKELRHVGYCGEDPLSRHMVVPNIIEKKQEDWDNYVLSCLLSCRSIAFTWPKLQIDSVHSCKFLMGNRMELLDTVYSYRVRPARIEKIVGHRIFLKLSIADIPPESLSKEDDQINGVWLEQDSPLLFYVGWSLKTGYGLLANESYKNHAKQVADAITSKKYPLPLDSRDADPQLFVTYEKHFAKKEYSVEWEKGMELEILDPADSYKELRCGTVLEVLVDGFLKIGFKGNQEDEDHIPIHCSSPLLFPVGYAENYGLKLKGPKDKYVTNHAKTCAGTAAPAQLFDSVDDHEQEIKSFKIGAKLEASDMCDAQLICPASVAHHRGRLLEISYDGWDESFNQLFEFRSGDLFPLGWCEMYGYRLEIPKGRPGIPTPLKNYKGNSRKH